MRWRTYSRSGGYKKPKNQTPISTGFPSADRLLCGGYRPSEVICLASPQETTNTHFLLRTAKVAEAQTEQTVLIVDFSDSFDSFSELCGSFLESSDVQFYYISEKDFTVKDLRECLKDDSIGTVLIANSEYMKANCDKKDWVLEECRFFDECNPDEFPHSCIVKELKELAKSFAVPIVVTQIIPETNESSLYALGISPDFDRTLFLRCDDQIWQFRTAEKNEALVPTPDAGVGERKSPPDLMRFIPSKDVREHLKKIGWQPDAVQVARLVLGNETILLYEKLKVLRQITETLPDVLLDLPSFVENRESLHECLSAYVRDEEELLASFGDDDNATFLCKGFEGDDCFYFRSVACTTLDACINKVLEKVPDDQRSSGHFNVCKFYTNERVAFSVTFNADRQPIDRSGHPNRKTTQIKELTREPFTLPHPFRRFDLVWLPWETDGDCFYRRTPILLDRLPEPAAATPNNSQFAAGYCCLGSDSLYYASPLPITELEYLPQGTFDLEEGMFSHLRDYLSGEKPLSNFVNHFAAFCMQTAANRMWKYYEADEPTALVPPVAKVKAFIACDDELPF